MAYTRKTSGTQLVVNIQQMSDGTFNWNVKENFIGAVVDTAAAAAKSAFTAAG